MEAASQAKVTSWTDILCEQTLQDQSVVQELFQRATAKEDLKES
jgi:hypothetical protein